RSLRDLSIQFWSLSHMTVSVLKIRFLPLEKAKKGKSEQVRFYQKLAVRIQAIILHNLLFFA
ncbi:MAG: hypothetical protein ABSA23_18585, partial [Anaerolineales bacterium]